MLAPFLRRSSASERAAVAGLLLDRGVQRDRTQAITRTTIGAATPSAPHPEGSSERTAICMPTFEEIEAAAHDVPPQNGLAFVRTRLATRGSSKPSRSSRSPRRSEAGSAARSKPRSERRRRSLLAVGVAFLTVVGLTVVGLTVLGIATTRSRKSPDTATGKPSYLVIDKLPEMWDVVGGVTLPAIPARFRASVRQTFTGPNSTGRISVSTQSFLPTFSDPTLGQPSTPLSAWMNQPQSTSRAFVRNWKPRVIGSAPDPNQILDLSWTERGVYVGVEARGLTDADVEAFAHALQPKSEDPLQGWRSPDDRFRPVDTTSDPGRAIGTRSAVAFRSRLDPNLNVVASMTEIADGQRDDPSVSEFDPTPTSSLVKLPSGKMVTLRRDTQSYGWSAEGFEFSVSYARGADDGRSIETDYSQGMPYLISGTGATSTFSATRVREIEQLVQRVQVGSKAQWSQQLSDHQARLLAVPVANHLTAGTYTVNLRVSTDPTVPQTACTHLLCSPVYRNNDRRSADLEIDSHWWHFEEVPASEPIPTWRTSPAAPAEAHPYYRQYGWYGVDLGPTAQAARRNDDNELLARPSYG